MLIFFRSNIDWVKTQEIVEIVRLCSELMKNKFGSLSRRHWDFGVLSLVSWASNCLKARASFERHEVNFVNSYGKACSVIFLILVSSTLNCRRKPLHQHR